MTPTAPITQDVLTIPRKLPEGKVNLVGLTREGLRAALIAHGTPERQAKMRVNQIWQWIYQWGVRDFAAMSNLAKGYRADLAERFVIEIPEVVNKQVSAFLPYRHAKAGAQPHGRGNHRSGHACARRS
jgi:23S rRNA (adenine2503-C2)-methyltransferase